MAIFTHVTLGSNDIEASARFYDAALGALGINKLPSHKEGSLMYGLEQPELGILPPVDGNPACHANGGTVGFAAPNRDAVDKFHAGGMANGGTSEGDPGPREFSPTAYGAYLRDPDGNKICAYCYAPE